MKLAADPLCSKCGRPATDVDHLDGNVHNLDWANLDSKCHRCHSRKTVAKDGGFGRMKSIHDQVTRILRARELGKRHYARADALLNELLTRMEPGAKVELPGKVVELVDNFAQKNVAFKPCGINRFDLKVSAA